MDADEVQIDGQADVTVNTTNLLVGGTGDLKGNITSNNIDVWGKLEGEVKVSGTLTIQEQGSVSGNIEYQELHIKLGGKIKGEVKSLDKIKKLPKSTKIYCGHEYTYKNAEFCIKHDSDNINLKKKFENIKKLRAQNLPTVPTSLEDELNSNIFLRCDQNDLKIKLNMENNEDYKVFRKVRDLKDAF